MTLFWIGVAAGFTLGVLAFAGAMVALMLMDDRKRRR